MNIVKQRCNCTQAKKRTKARNAFARGLLGLLALNQKCIVAAGLFSQRESSGEVSRHIGRFNRGRKLHGLRKLVFGVNT